MFEQSSPESPSSTARKRLSDLADQARAATDCSPALPAAGRLVERWVPAALMRSPQRRRLTAVGAVSIAVIVLVGASILLLRGGPPAERPPSLPTAPAHPAPVAAATSLPGKATDRSLVVSVVGKVASPGLVTLPTGARVADALQAAGGVVDGADITTLNLARKLSDGEQLYVGIPVPAQAQVGQAQAGRSGGDTPPGKLDLNSASVEQLDSLPGVGEVTAKRIVDWRTSHGGFSSVEQLRDVDGIGQSKFSRLRDLVTVS